MTGVKKVSAGMGSSCSAMRFCEIVFLNSL